jgi:hypothetical protein
MAINAARPTRTVADPIAEYDSLMPLWKKSRAVCSGERYVKEFDAILDVRSFTNLLIPFSNSMTQEQYNFYKAEGELPGITAQFAKMLVGGLLRKKPELSFAEGIDTDGVLKDWLLNSFSQDGGTLSSFMDTALWDELQTSRSWIYIDHPMIDSNDVNLESKLLVARPYPVLWKAEDVISWRYDVDAFGNIVLNRVIVRDTREDFSKNEWHAEFIDVVKVHELNDAGNYVIRTFEEKSASANPVLQNGARVTDYTSSAKQFEEVGDPIVFQMRGKPLGFIPAWPLNGSIAPIEPMLMPIIDKEIALYNKISRRNHLMYGAATYTPVISTDMPDDEFDEMVSQGLGTWLRLRSGDTADILQPPTSALADMDRAIAAGVEEMARMGIRMLSPETSQSGVALQLRNAAQTAQLGTLNMKISDTLKQIMLFVINWRYDLQLTSSDITFNLSNDFSPTPLGADWLRLATEWYQGGLIPRGVWLSILKQNDLLEPDYDDIKGQEEINGDNLIPDTTTPPKGTLEG